MTLPRALTQEMPRPVFTSARLREGQTETGEYWGREMGANLQRLAVTANPSFTADLDHTDGLSLGYRGGWSWTGAAWALIADGNGLTGLTLTPAGVHYVERGAGTAPTLNTVGFSPAAIPMFRVTTEGGQITDILDARPVGDVVTGGGPPPPPGAHHATHEAGGSDQIAVTGLLGLLADPQTPLPHTHPWSDITGPPATFPPAPHPLVGATHTVAGLTPGHVLTALTAVSFGFAAPAAAPPAAHHLTHENGGADELSVLGLSGLLADPQTPTVHTHDWTTGITGKPATFPPSPHTHDYTTDITGKPATFAPSAHKVSHQDGGTDELLVTGLAGLLADPQTALPHGLVSAFHTVAGLTVGHVLTALTAVTFGFAAPAAAAPHHLTHELGGTDVISVAGLSGLLATPQTPAAHALVSATHTAAGLTAGHVLRATGAATFAFGQVQYADIAGTPASLPPTAHKLTHQDGGTDEISVLGLSGLLADPQTPLAHTHDYTTGITGKPATFPASPHDLVSATHTAAGLTAGHVLQATGAATFAFAALAVGSLPAHTHSAADIVGGNLDWAELPTGAGTWTATPTITGILRLNTDWRVSLGVNAVQGGVFEQTVTGLPSPRLVFQNTPDAVGNAIYQLVGGNLVITTGATYGGASGTPRLSIAQTGVVTLANQLIVQTGGLTVSAGGFTVTGASLVTGGSLTVANAAGGVRDIVLATSPNSPRWILRANSTAEGGANAGSDFELYARDDVGAAIGVVMTVTRAAAGAVSFLRPVGMNSTLTVSGGGIVVNAGGISVTGSSSITGVLTVQSAAAADIRIRETGQVLPLGLWGFVLSADNLYIRKNTAAAGDFSTQSIALRIDATGTIISGLWKAQVHGLAYGGTGSNLSATGPGVLKQAALGAVVTVGALVAGDLPAHTHSAADITAGTFPGAYTVTGQLTLNNHVLVQGAGALRFENTWATNPATATGPGMEMGLNTGNFYVSAWNRTTNAGLPLLLVGSQVALGLNDTGIVTFIVTGHGITKTQFDAANYFTATVDATGLVVFAATGAGFRFDSNVTIGAAPLANTRLLISGVSPTTRFGLRVSGTFTAASTNAQAVHLDPTMVAAANNDALIVLRVQPVTFTVGAFTGISVTGLYIGDITGAANNYAIYTNAGDVRFGTANVSINAVAYTWPAANASGILRNSGTGALSWATSTALTALVALAAAAPPAAAANPAQAVTLANALRTRLILAGLFN